MKTIFRLKDGKKVDSFINKKNEKIFFDGREELEKAFACCINESIIEYYKVVNYITTIEHYDDDGNLIESFEVYENDDNEIQND